MTWIDHSILAAYFIVMIGAGVWYSRRSAQGIRSYFLGNNQSKWWMLAASGASTNYSVNGTVWNIAMLMVLGMKSWWIVLIWWMPNAVFLMAYSGIWIRRTGVMTSAELNKARFGEDRGARAARISFAVMVALFSISQLSLSYLVIHKFAQIFGFSGHSAAMTVIGATGLYVLIGGFRGVILTDLLQTLLLFVISFLVGWLCYMQYTASELTAALSHGSVTMEYWKSLAYDPNPDLGEFAKSSYQAWEDFAGAALAFSVVGLIGCLGGAGGRYGEQRFLAAKTAREAGMLAALWQVLAVPRWVLTAGLAFLAFTLFKDQTVLAADPDAAIPLFLESDLLATGAKGLVVTGLVAAYMSTFSSEVNATASIIVRDIVQPLAGGPPGNERKGMVTSYMATVALVALTMGLGCLFVAGSSLNAVWTWMLGGLVTCYVVPLAMRWYWGRMNGWGFAAGSLIGLIPALCMLSKQFLPEGAWIQTIPDSWFTYSILALSFVTCIAVSLLTRPVRPDHIDTFYRRVRPFGWWKAIRDRALVAGRETNAPIPLSLIAVNVPLGVAATYALYMIPVYLLGKWYFESVLCTGIFAACCIALYFTWYRTLPRD